MRWEYDDGGRPADAGGDCLVRALAIAGALPYAEARAALGRYGTYWQAKRAMRALGWRWTGRRRRARRLPPRCVAVTPGHAFAVVDGVTRDMVDAAKAGRQRVVGFFENGA